MTAGRRITAGATKMKGARETADLKKGDRDYSMTGAAAEYHPASPAAAWESRCVLWPVTCSLERVRGDGENWEQSSMPAQNRGPLRPRAARGDASRGVNGKEATGETFRDTALAKGSVAVTKFEKSLGAGVTTVPEPLCAARRSKGRHSVIYP